jgi:hypothetical protein
MRFSLKIQEELELRLSSMMAIKHLFIQQEMAKQYLLKKLMPQIILDIQQNGKKLVKLYKEVNN